MYVILLNLLLLAAEHYVAIIKPMKYERWIHCHFIALRVLMIWIVPILLVYIGHLIPPPKITIAYYWQLNPGLPEEKGEIDITMKDAFCIPFVILVLLVMVIVYVYIYCTLRFANNKDLICNKARMPKETTGH